MTVDEKLSRGAVEIQDTWTSLTDTWIRAAEDLLSSASPDPFGLFHPDGVIDQMFDFTRRALEINCDLISTLTSVSITAEEAVMKAATPIGVAVPPLDQPQTVEPARAELVPSEREGTRPIAARKYSRVSKADLQQALSRRHLPKTGTIKELRERLIEADLKAAK
jgi:hypothetical protein